MKTTLLLTALAIVVSGSSTAQDAGNLDEATANRVHASKPPYSPYAGGSFPSRPFFGDTHLHTSYSMDAGAFGSRLDPFDAYRFAKGEELTASAGMRVRLSRPLDFLVVADHSDGFGFFPLIVSGDPSIMGRTGAPMEWND